MVSERSIDHSLFVYGFTGGMSWNWLHTSCEIIKWESESTVLELSASFKGEWISGVNKIWESWGFSWCIIFCLLTWVTHHLFMVSIKL